MATQALFIACTPGLEPALEAELAELGHPGRAVPGGVELTAPAGAYRELNLWSRVASRVLVRVGAGTSPAELARLPLAPFGRAFTLELGDGAGRFRDVLSAQVGQGEGPTLLARMDGARCVVSVDTSGELLYQRGYRQEVGRAPLRETLAAGVLRLAGWRPGEPLWDVMCGSGTILIEAAEQAAGLAPGRNRRFAFDAFPAHDEAGWRAVPRQRPAVATPLFGSDVNAGALGTARRNARRAGVVASLSLERLDATRLPSRPGPGLIVANLPYGKRVGERSELGALYRGLGQAIRRSLAGWRYAFLLEEGAEQLGLPLGRRLPVRNGGLRCELVVGP